MQAYVFGENQIVAVANNKDDARATAIARLYNHPELAEMVAQIEPIEVPENHARILFTSWVESK